MKNYFLLTACLLMSLSACKQSETKILTSENPDGTVTTTTVETEKSTGLDSAKINATVDKAKEKLNVAGEKIDDAADRAGETLQEAGEDLKVAAQKGAQKVEEGAEKVQNDLKKK